MRTAELRPWVDALEARAASAASPRRTRRRSGRLLAASRAERERTLAHVRAVVRQAQAARISQRMREVDSQPPPMREQLVQADLHGHRRGQPQTYPRQPERK